jgi:hypothetical protein
MASKNNVEEDLKQKKVNFDWLKKNNMDIAELVTMARKSKGQPLTDDSDEWVEEVIEDDDEVADDLVLAKKTPASSTAAFHIPQFQPKKPAPGPNKRTTSHPNSQSLRNHPKTEKKLMDLNYFYCSLRKRKLLKQVRPLQRP